MSLVASRMSRIQPSASATATQRARELRAGGRDIIALTQGEPDFETPDHVKEAASRAMAEGQTRYTFAGGTPELKAAVARKFREENGLEYGPEQIVVGAGGKQVLFNAIMASVEPGEEVIVPTPFWVSYPDMTRFAEGVPVLLPCGPDTGFKLTPDALEAAITPRTKWLVLNSPNNPSGATYSPDELRALGEVLLRHPAVHVMTDDMYEHILFDDREFVTIAQAVPALYERTLTVNGVSKAYAMTGWRIGYAGGPASLVKEMVKLQGQSTGNPSSISQAAAIEALSGPQDFIPGRARAFQERRDLVVSMLNQAAGLECHRPEGAFYVYPGCARLLGRRTPDGRRLETDEDVSLYLLDAEGVATVHGGAYGLSPYFRVSIASSTEVLEEACARIQRACAALV
jgi:aspartate aminotransferase